MKKHLRALKKILVSLIVLGTLSLNACGSAQEALERVEGEIRNGIEDNSGSEEEEFFPMPTPEPDEEPLPFPTPEEPPIGPINCPVLNPGPPVGLACLHCAAPSARTQALIIASMIRRACRENVATTILLDGTFGDDLQLVMDIIEEITREGSRLHLYVYVSNGPWLRRDGHAGGIFTDISIDEWNWRIQTDTVLRNAFSDNIRNLSPVFQTLIEAGGVLYVLPGLEDNFSFDAARAAEALTLATMAEAFPLIPFGMGRNPCCGADRTISPGWFRDSHNIRDMPSDGLSTNDGEDFEINEIPPFITQAGLRNTTFVYWTRSFQGIAPGNTFPDPAIRDYRIPGEAEQEQLIDLIN